MSLSKQQAIDILKAQQQQEDTELAHVEADAVLCNLLESLGFSEVVAEFKKVTKWYG